MRGGVEAADGGAGISFVALDEYRMPTGTLGDIRAIIASGSYAVGVDDNGYYYPLYYFADTVVEEAYAFIQFGENGTRYQSTSGADDATWEIYD